MARAPLGGGPSRPEIEILLYARDNSPFHVGELPVQHVEARGTDYRRVRHLRDMEYLTDAGTAKEHRGPDRKLYEITAAGNEFLEVNDLPNGVSGDCNRCLGTTAVKNANLVALTERCPGFDELGNCGLLKMLQNIPDPQVT